MHIKTNEFSIFILSLQKYSIGCEAIMIYEKTTMKADDLIFNNQCEKYVYNENQLLGRILFYQFLGLRFIQQLI
jgi:hypothetical protein